MTGRKLLFAAIAVAIVQIGFLGSAVFSRAALLRNGQEVVLRTQPIDPHDLLRGDYVALTYDVSQVPVGLVRTARPYDSDMIGTIYVRLRRGEGQAPATVAAAGLGTPLDQPLGEGEVDIKGTSFDRWEDGLDFVNVQYGLERFYVPEGEGLEIERSLGERQFTMRVAVAKTGEAQIKALYDGATPLYAEPLY